jgi:hypothetical protein
VARTVLVCLVLLAASPCHAPFSTFEPGHHQSHAHSQAASALKVAQDQQFNAGLAPFDVSAVQFEHVAVSSTVLTRSARGLHQHLSVLRL